jgi:hypothetical protein
LAAYAGVLSSFGLGFVLNDRVQRPLIVLFLAIAVASVAWSARRGRSVWPLVIDVLASLAIIAGRIVWSISPLVYPAVLMLIVGALWNVGLRFRSSRPFKLSSAP